MLKQYLFSFFILITSLVNAQTDCPIIPQPISAKPSLEMFRLDNHSFLKIADKELQGIKAYTRAAIKRHAGIDLAAEVSSKGTSIELILEEKNAGVTPSAASYSITMGKDAVRIMASSVEGMFNGVSSLLQLIALAEKKVDAVVLRCWQIKDSPGYAWRGLMLDESRHFFGKEKVKSLIDWMAFYKLNRFHWHLTDEPGWRMEVKKYPKLSAVGGMGNFSDAKATVTYYTQEEIKEVVAYAADRFVVVIPEIDMPGHATAANRAYPAFSGGGSKAHPEFTFNPGKEGTYSYLTDILKETASLFPSSMIHLGGDEVNFGNQQWPNFPEIQSLMAEKKLKDLRDVELYFMQRMADTLYKMNTKLLAWDEMADVELPRDKTIIMWWRHDKPEQFIKAMDKGYTTIACPRIPFYFDFVQDSTHQQGRKWKKAYAPLEAVYGYDLSSFKLTDAKQKLVAGIQANIWTETMQNEERLDYMLFPRIAGLAEAAWRSNSAAKDFSLFKQRLKSHLELYNRAGLFYFDPLEPAKRAEPLGPKK